MRRHHLSRVPPPPPQNVAYSMVDRSQEKTLTCRVHGVTAWKFTFMCRECRAVWQMLDADATRALPKHNKCDCGRKLLPEHPDDKNFTAGIICTECFKAKV